MKLAQQSPELLDYAPGQWTIYFGVSYYFGN